MAALSLNDTAFAAGAAITFDYPGKVFFVAHRQASAFMVPRNAKSLRDLLAFLREHNALEETEQLVASRWELFRMGWRVFGSGDIDWTWTSQVNPVWLRRGWYVSLKDWLDQQEVRQRNGRCIV